jgi:rhodanese-related sulfurtransferase
MMKSATLKKIDTGSLRAELAGNSGVKLLDVRTPGEFQSGHIDGSVNVPLDQIDSNLDRIVDGSSGRMVVICQAGGRASEAAGKLSAGGASDVVVLDQGMNAWLAAGAPVESSGQQRWALERQVRLMAGGIVATSIIGSIWEPRLRFVAGGIGAGLVYAAVSNTCAMGKMLMKLPYNKGSEGDVNEAIDCLCR